MLKLVSLKIRLIVAAALVLLMGIGAVFAALIIIIAGAPSAASAACGPPTNEVPPAPGESANEQIANAKIIDATAAKLGLPGTASRIAIIAAIGESSLINLDHGDNAINPDGSVADSLGLFQQQPSQGWGTAAQVRDPEYATTSFLTGSGHDNKGGLVAVAGWEKSDPTVAIHAVQRNADPNHYARYYSQADEIIATAGIDVSRSGKPIINLPTVPGNATAPDTAAPAPNCSAPEGSGTAVLPLDRPFNMSDNYGPRKAPTAGASSWHAADDLVNPSACGKPIYASVPGTVTLSDRLYLSIENPDGYTVSYLHSHKSDRLVSVGQTVTMGQQISVVGNESPATGCHLDVRIYTVGTTNSAVAALPVSGADTGSPGFVDPEAFYAVFGLTLCDNTCKRQYTD